MALIIAKITTLGGKLHVEPDSMRSSTRSNLIHFLHGIAWFLFGGAGLTFWFGGGVISAVANTDRFTGELAGVGLAGLLAILGAIAKGAEDHLEMGQESEGPTSLGEALRK